MLSQNCGGRQGGDVRDRLVNQPRSVGLCFLLRSLKPELEAEPGDRKTCPQYTAFYPDMA